MSIKNKMAKTARAKCCRAVRCISLKKTIEKDAPKLFATRCEIQQKLRVIAATGTNGKNPTTINFFERNLEKAGYKTAMFSTANIEIDGEQTVNDTNSTAATVARLQKFFKQAAYGRCRIRTCRSYKPRAWSAQIRWRRLRNGDYDKSYARPPRLSQKRWKITPTRKPRFSKRIRSLSC